MKLMILVAVAAMALAVPGSYSIEGSGEEADILRQGFHLEDDGRYSLDVETSNGISLSRHGSPTGPKGAVVKSGVFSYTARDGTPVHVKFVADENGFQPDSDLLPVVLESPHPIPQFVLNQIAKAAEEDREVSKSKSYA